MGNTDSSKHGESQSDAVPVLRMWQHAVNRHNRGILATSATHHEVKELRELTDLLHVRLALMQGKTPPSFQGNSMATQSMRARAMLAAQAHAWEDVREVQAWTAARRASIRAQKPCVWLRKLGLAPVV